MNDLIIEPTKKTPLVEFHTNGKLTLAGSSYPENVRDFYAPVMDWVNELETEEITLDLIMDYTNTASAKVLLDLLRKFDLTSRFKTVTINWYYEEDDEDTLEAGQILEDVLTNSNFKYVAYEKSARE
jgi:hypothetical protein